MLQGIDVSHHQGQVNWRDLKSRYGIAFGAAKATEGKTFKDASFPNNWQGMNDAGLVRMAYHFAHPDTDASASALPFLSYVESCGLKASDIMVMDMEGNSNNLPMLAVRDWLAEWADIVTRETGRKPFIYVGAGYITNDATKDLKSHYAGWWFPRYPNIYNGKTYYPTTITGYPTPNNWGSAPDIWQFSQSFANTYDANIANMTLADLETRGTIRLELDMLDTTDKTYIDGRLKAYLLWSDMRNARRELLIVKAKNEPDAVVAVAQSEYDSAYASWKAVAQP